MIQPSASRPAADSHNCRPESQPSRTIPPDWHGKPYYSLDAYCKNVFGHKCYKIALNAGMTCPNRDGKLGTGGCIFCSKGGSGEFAVATGQKTIGEQLEEGLALFHSKKVGENFIAYFQAYTNTYAPVSALEKIFTEALLNPKVCGISIATRPDCLPQEVMALLTSLKERFPDKFIWIEMGLQTVNEKTASLIRRGFILDCFEDAVHRLNAIHIPIIVHVILGLPGEDRADIFRTIRYLNTIRPFGVKLQLLHVLKDTDLAGLFAAGGFDVLTKEAYLDILIHCLELLSPDIVVHRLTGDGPRPQLIAPRWSLHKRDVLNTLHRLMRERGAFQGKLFHEKDLST